MLTVGGEGASEQVFFSFVILWCMLTRGLNIDTHRRVLKGTKRRACTSAEYLAKTPQLATADNICKPITPPCDQRTTYESIAYQSALTKREAAYTDLERSTGRTIPIKGVQISIEYGNDRVCSQLTVCSKIEFETTAGTLSTDRVVVCKTRV